MVEARYANDQERREKILNRLKTASNNEATARLMRSPLQVTIMAALVDKVGKPPQERWTLFRDYYKIIYDREVERDIPAAEILRDYKPDVDIIHYRVGLLLQIEGESSGSTDARLSSARLTEIIRGRLVEEEHSEDEVKMLVEKITRAAAERLVFIAGLEADRVGFEIRSFQEFMAAECLMEGNDESVHERLREIAPIAYWRNVFLFASGKCFAERQHLREVISTLCDEMNEGNNDEALHVTLAGSQLALDLLEDGSARRQPKYAQILARKALKLLVLPPADYHKRLAEVYEPGLEHVYHGELKERLSLRHSEQRLGAWACLSHLIENNVYWVEELVKSNWSENREEKLALLPIASSKGIKSRIFSKLADSLALFSPSELWGSFFSQQDNIGWKNRDETTKLLAVINPLLPTIHDVFHPHKFATEVPVLLTNDNSSSLKLSYWSIESKEHNWSSLTNLSEFHPAWTPYIAAARFLKNPSRFALARELRAIAHFWLDNQFAVRGVPWPIRACCLAAKTGDELLKYADCAETGEFGDVEDWRKAELRWQKEGVTEIDFLYATDDHWPFNRQIATRGFPFVNSRLSMNGSLLEETILSKLLATREKLGTSFNRRHMTANILFILWIDFLHHGPYTVDKIIDYKCLKELCTENEEENLTWINLQLLANCENTFSDSEKNLAADEQIALAQCAANLICQSNSSSISQTLGETEVIGRALSVIRNYKARDGSIETFLLALHKNLPDREWERTYRVVEALTQILRLRLSRLHKPQVWSGLKLPAELGKLIQVGSELA